MAKLKQFKFEELEANLERARARIEAIDDILSAVKHHVEYYQSFGESDTYHRAVIEHLNNIACIVAEYESTPF